MTKKFFDMIGYDPASVQGDELTDVFDTEKVVAARQEYEAAVASYGAEQESLEQDAVEFFNPISQEGLDQLRNNGGGLMIPGVRLRKINDFSDQNFSSFLTVPAAIAEERVRLGGSVFSNPFTSFDPSDKEVGEMIEKYNLDTSLPGFGRLLEAESLEDLEARAIVTKRRQDRLRQIAIDNQGATGLVGMMGMSLLDPTLYVTGGVATGMLTARVLNSATKTGAALRFTADGLTKGEKFKVGAAGYLLGEAPIELANATQAEDFDPATTLAFMALAPLVGGAFNTLGRDGVDGDALKAAIALDEAIAKGIVPPDFKGTDSGAGGAAQSGAVPRTVDEDGIPGAPPRSSAWTFGTPLNFLARSADPLTRLVAGRLSNNPWTGGSKGTTAFEAQRRIYNAQSVAIRDLRMAAKEYFGKGVTSPTTAQLDDFFKQVGQHLEGYAISENPAVIRAADALRPKYADGLAYLQDPNYLPGREKSASSPTAPAGSPPAPPAPKAPDAPEAVTPATPDAPEAVTTATPDAPEPISAPDAPTAASAAPETVAPAPDATGINPEAPKGTARDYFGRKSFRSGSSETVPPKSDIAPVGASPREAAKALKDEIAAYAEFVKTADADQLRAANNLHFDRGFLIKLQAPVLTKMMKALGLPAPSKETSLSDMRQALEKALKQGPEGNTSRLPDEAPAAPLSVTKAASRPDAEGYTKVTLSDGTTTRLFYDRDGMGLPGWYLDEGDLYGSGNVKSQSGHIEPWLGSNKAEALANLPERLARTREKFAKKPEPAKKPAPSVGRDSVPQIAKAADKVIEAAPDALPERNDLRVALKAYTEAFEAIVFKTDKADPEMVKVASQLRNYLQGATAGTNKSFQMKYVDGLQRLTRALEDMDDDAADKLLASVIDDLDNGYGSKLSAELNKDAGLMASRAGGLERAAEAEQVRAENAELYETFKAAFDFGQGPYKKPSLMASTAIVGAGAASAAAAVAIYEDAPDEVKAGITALAAGIGLAAGFATGKARVRHWEKNTPSIGIFAGPMAKGVDLKALQKAQKMEKAGTDRDVIWRETGWGRMGPAGEWLTEIRDPMGGLNDMLTDLKVRLGDVLDAPKIMRAYADLYEVRMQTGELLKFLMDTQADGVANLGANTMAVRMDMNRAEQLRVAIHEINHLIQGQRNRQVPGATEMNDRAMDAWKELNKVSKEYDDLFYQVQYELEAGPEKTAAIERLDALAQQIDELNPASREFYQYLTLDLEAESRLVETRLGLTAKQARERPPWYDLDVEEGDLWMARQVGRYAASLGSDVKAFRDQKWWDENVEEGVFGPDHELNGQRYWKNDQVYAWVEDIGDGEGSFNWDWIENVESGKLFEDNPNASPAQSARAFAFAQVSLERTLKSGEFTVVTFEGLKKPKPGQDASGHERVQEFLMGRADTTGYVATKGSWKIKMQGQETTRSSFAFIREGMDVEETWRGIRQGKVTITEIAKAPKREPQLAASRSTPGSEPSTPPKAPEAEDTYKGLEEWRNVAFDDGYQPRQFNQQGWRRVISSAEYRNNPTKLGNRFGDLFLRNDPQRFEEIGQRLGISAQEAAWRTGRKYIDTVAELMNGAGAKGPKANRINPADREAAKEIVREMLNKGDPFDDTSEEALELILDIVAPIRKDSAESPRARPRMNFKLSKEFDEDIADIFEWNAEKLFVSYSRHISGYAGILRAGYRSVAELNNEIKQIRENAKFDSAGRQSRAEKEANLLEAMRDAILGVPPKEDLARPEWQFVVNQIRRLNFGNLMNNVGFLALSEVAGALTRVNVVKMFKLFPEYQRYIKLARAGDPKAQESIFALADITMGHGSAQLRSRVGSVEDRASGEAPSLEDRADGIKDGIDRFTRKQANAVARFSGMSPIQEWLRMTIVTAEAQDWVKAARSGKPPYAARRMAQMGIDAPMWQRISAELRKWGDINSPDTRRPVPNMDLASWGDDEALNFFINALDRNANRIVMEGDLGHTALFFRNKPAASLFFQFLNFPLNAFTKHLGFAAKTRDVRAAAEVLVMMMGGAAGYVARVQAQANAQDTEEEKQKILAERLTDAEIGKAMLYYSAHGSVIPNVLDLGLWLGESGGVPNPIPGYEGETVKPLFNKTRASGVPGNPVTGNPTISRVNQIPKSLGDMATGTPFSEQDVQGAIKALAPFGNHIAVTALLDRMLEFLPDEEDSIEDAVQQ